MEEFTLDAFYNSLISYIANSFPYLNDEEVDGSKHPNRNPLHLKDAVFDNLPNIVMNDQIIFDIGNPRLEETHPYYHILEDSEVIRKKNKGTKTSKGSQDQISDKGARDYGIVKWNGKTFTQEYKKNVRGARSKAQKATRRAFFVDSYGQVFRTQINKDAKYYLNIHYHYIEKAIDNAVPSLCAQFGLKPLRVKDTRLSDEYQMDQDTKAGFITPLNMLDIINSFGEDS
jgi:hypothetical protein